MKIERLKKICCKSNDDSTLKKFRAQQSKIQNILNHFPSKLSQTLLQQSYLAIAHWPFCLFFTVSHPITR
jgi:hypothetical protein